jgi:signal transduction histidine kinase
MLSLALAMLALLPLLAVLQYHMLGKVSEGERELRKNTLTTMARQFCQEFDRELTAINLYFQPTLNPFDGEIDQARDDFIARYRHWRETATRPRMIKAIYQTQRGENDFSLARFNTETGVFELCEWPESMAKVRKKLNENRARRESLRVIMQEMKWNVRSEGGPKKMVFQLSLNCVDEDLPGLVIPIGDHTGENSMPMLFPQSYRIIALDSDYLSREFIPELAKRHFGESVVDYRIAVTKFGRTDQVIYRSEVAASKTDLDGGDVTTGFFKIRLIDADKFFLAQSPHANVRAAPGVALQSIRRSRVPQIAIRVASENNSGKDKNIPAPPNLALGAVTDDLSRSLLNRNDEGVWQLIVKHRAGSLEAAVTNARRRNIAISFGILLLLGASIGFIILSSRRAQRLATQQMEFVAGVSHELRTPLAVICSAAENLADGVIDDRGQIERYGSLIRDEGRRLTGMVERILEFAGTQSGRRNYELRPTELSSVIEDAIATCHMQLAEGGFEIERKIAVNLPTVEADGAALSRAIQNLLSNAMKYSGDSRWIGLSVEMARTSGGEEVWIGVADRGLGIETSEIERIFEPFYRGKEALGAQIRGNGLGLSLVKHIVEAHGGRMSVESMVGRGSLFTLQLPVPAVTESSAVNI